MANANFAIDNSPQITISRPVPRMVDLKEVSRVSGLSVPRLRYGFRSGELVGVRCGTSRSGKILLNLDKLIDFLNSHTEKPESEPSIMGQICPVKL